MLNPEPIHTCMPVLGALFPVVEDLYGLIGTSIYHLDVAEPRLQLRCQQVEGLDGL